MRKLITIVFFLIGLTSFSQTTPLTFTQLGTTPDIIANDRGAEYWNGRIWDNGVGGALRIPVGNTTAYDYYYRFLWANDIEKTTIGVYDFTLFDTQINIAIDNGRVFKTLDDHIINA